MCIHSKYFEFIVYWDLCATCYMSQNCMSMHGAILNYLLSIIYYAFLYHFVCILYFYNITVTSTSTPADKLYCGLLMLYILHSTFILLSCII